MSHTNTFLYKRQLLKNSEYFTKNGLLDIFNGHKNNTQQKSTEHRIDGKRRKEKYRKVKMSKKKLENIENENVDT